LYALAGMSNSNFTFTYTLFSDVFYVANLYYRGPGGGNLAYYRVFSSRSDALKNLDPIFKVLFIHH